jgi:hypothetical protein
MLVQCFNGFVKIALRISASALKSINKVFDGADLVFFNILRNFGSACWACFSSLLSSKPRPKTCLAKWMSLFAWRFHWIFHDILANSAVESDQILLKRFGK